MHGTAPRHARAHVTVRVLFVVGTLVCCLPMPADMEDAPEASMPATSSTLICQVEVLGRCRGGVLEVCDINWKTCGKRLEHPRHCQGGIAWNHSAPMRDTGARLEAVCKVSWGYAGLGGLCKVVEGPWMALEVLERPWKPLESLGRSCTALRQPWTPPEIP